MNPVKEISADQVAYWAEHDPTVHTFGAPDCLDNCEPAQAIATHTADGLVVRVPWKLDEIELAHLAQGGTLWLSTWGGLPPHMLEVQAP